VVLPSRPLTKSEGHLAGIAADIQQAARPVPLAALPLQLINDERHARIACRRRRCCYRCIGRSRSGADVVVRMKLPCWARALCARWASLARCCGAEEEEEAAGDADGECSDMRRAAESEASCGLDSTQKRE
jgi:hypothetical protein